MTAATLADDGITVEVGDEFITIHGDVLAQFDGVGFGGVATLVHTLLAHQGGEVDLMGEGIYFGTVPMTRATASRLATALTAAEDELHRRIARDRWGVELTETADGHLLIPLSPLAAVGMDVRLLRLLAARKLIVGEFTEGECDWETGEELSAAEWRVDIEAVLAQLDTMRDHT